MELTGNVIRGRSRIILFMLWFVNNLIRNVPHIGCQNLALDGIARCLGEKKMPDLVWIHSLLNCKVVLLGENQGYNLKLAGHSDALATMLIQMLRLHGGLSPTLLLYLCILKSNTLTCCGQRRTICSRVWQHFRLRFRWIIWSQRCNRLQNDTHIKLCHLNRQTTTCCYFQTLCLLCLTSQTEKTAWSFASSWLRVISSTWHTFWGPFDKRKAKKRTKRADTSPPWEGCLHDGGQHTVAASDRAILKMWLYKWSLCDTAVNKREKCSVFTITIVYFAASVALSPCYEAIRHKVLYSEEIILYIEGQLCYLVGDGGGGFSHLPVVALNKERGFFFTPSVAAEGKEEWSGRWRGGRKSQRDSPALQWYTASGALPGDSGEITLNSDSNRSTWTQGFIWSPRWLYITAALPFVFLGEV